MFLILQVNVYTVTPYSQRLDASNAYTIFCLFWISIAGMLRCRGMESVAAPEWYILRRHELQDTGGTHTSQYMEDESHIKSHATHRPTCGAARGTAESRYVLDKSFTKSKPGGRCAQAFLPANTQVNAAKPRPRLFPYRELLRLRLSLVTTPLSVALDSPFTK